MQPTSNFFHQALGKLGGGMGKRRYSDTEDFDDSCEAGSSVYWKWAA